MRLKKAFSIISILNLFALVIVYQQTEITKYGYRNKQKEDFVQQLVDKRNYLKYELEYSKSPGNIKNRLSAFQAEFNLPQEKQVVLLQTLHPAEARTQVLAANKEQTLFSKVFFWLTPTAEAQAEGGE